MDSTGDSCLLCQNVRIPFLNLCSPTATVCPMSDTLVAPQITTIGEKNGLPITSNNTVLSYFQHLSSGYVFGNISPSVIADSLFFLRYDLTVLPPSTQNFYYPGLFFSELQDFNDTQNSRIQKSFVFGVNSDQSVFSLNVMAFKTADLDSSLGLQHFQFYYPLNNNDRPLNNQSTSIETFAIDETKSKCFSFFATLEDLLILSVAKFGDKFSVDYLPNTNDGKVFVNFGLFYRKETVFPDFIPIDHSYDSRYLSYYLNQMFASEEKCLDNCVKCFGKFYCLECKTNFYIDTFGNCVGCSQECEGCSEIRSKCIKCKNSKISISKTLLFL